MKKCLVVPLVGLAISFALSTYAQQKDLADPQTTQKLLALGKAAEEAHNNHDAAAVAAQCGFCYAGGNHHRSASHSEMAHRPVAVVAPQKLHGKGRRECLSLDRYGWQRTLGNRRI